MNNLIIAIFTPYPRLANVTDGRTDIFVSIIVHSLAITIEVAYLKTYNKILLGFFAGSQISQTAYRPALK